MISPLNWLQQMRSPARPETMQCEKTLIVAWFTLTFLKHLPKASVGNFPVTQNILSIALEKDNLSKQKL